MSRILVIVCLITRWVAHGDGLDGTWLANLQNGGQSTPVLFMFSGSSEGRINGQVVSVARNVTHKLEAVKIDEKRVGWTVPRTGGKFEGAFAGDGKSIEGTWSEPAGKQPLRMTRYNANSFSLPLGSGIDAFVPFPPRAVRADGRFHLMYELHVTNWDASEVNVERLEVVIDGESARLEGELLKGLFLSGKSSIGPGVRTAIILMLSSSSRPASIEHRLMVKRVNQPGSIEVPCAKLNVVHDVVRLSSPVRGKDWVMNEGPNIPSHHRTGLLALNGRITNFQRFAFDMHKAEDARKDSEIRPMENRDYPSYGEEVLAVADATVVSVRDDLPDLVPHGLTSPMAMTAETITGNHVVLDLGAGRYVLYAHLQPQLRLRKGDRVVRAQVLGKIGNSGRSNAPHLHFQVADGPTMDDEGIPFVFDFFEKDGTAHTDEMPLHGWRISFPDK